MVSLCPPAAASRERVLSSEFSDVYRTALPGLSDTVYSATAFYDWLNFSTRINVRYRSEFVSEQVAVETQLAFFDAETVVDYQASYAINDNLSVLFQVNNLTDEPTKTYFNQEAQTGTVQFFGRQYFLGVSYGM